MSPAPSAAPWRDPATVVITGASGGIGAALARAYARPGRRLALTGRDAARLEAVAQACRAAGAEVVTAGLDVRDAAALAAFLAQVDAGGPLDLVIANAGVSSGVGQDGAGEDWASARRTLSINLDGTLNTVQPAVDLMRRRGHRGQIAVIGSLAAWRGLPSCPAYSASKAAIEAYGEGLRGMLRGDGISVCVISPGYVTSPMSERVAGHKPFLMDADRAAGIIRGGLARDRGRISFPLPLAVGTRLLTLLPGWLADRILPLFAFSVRPDTRP
ncbi:SDR family NAD(P)-dependent oxidoreductase [Novispirillum sp. DQ9]|uniref:SDR family NAD(P)-dependent oxidoreductase n=1 Tax=Novispirillum sp. DQ9 TaxID=3398612 RepID=UPI003C7B4C7A